MTDPTMNAFTDVGTFLIQSLATLYLVIILLRFLLQLCGADFFNPVSQFAHRATAPLLLPLRRLFPAWRNFDLRSEEHTSELQSRENLVCRLLLEKKKTI